MKRGITAMFETAALEFYASAPTRATRLTPLEIYCYSSTDNGWSNDDSTLA